MSRAHVLLSSLDKENYQLISQKWQSNVIGSQQSADINELELEKNDDFVMDDIINRLTGVEFFRWILIYYKIIFYYCYHIGFLNLTNKIFCFRLLCIEPKKRLETLIYNYNVFNKTLEDDVSFEKLDKLSNEDIKTEVPFEIYIEGVDDESLKLKVGYSWMWFIAGIAYFFQQVS